MIKQLTLGILLAGSSGIALSSPNTGDITPHRGVLSFIGSFFGEPKAEKREIIVERGPFVRRTSKGRIQQITASAPEIDPASAVSGLTLLVGGIAVMAATRRRTLQV